MSEQTDTATVPMDAASLTARARAWLAQDPDPQTRGELEQLIARAYGGDDAAAADLYDRFAGRLAFGTAGLRGALGAGSNRMNRVLVCQAAAGLASYLREKAGEGHRPTAVIGYDGRHNSLVFAEDSAQILAGAGIRTILLPRVLPTPVLAFAVRYFEADAGVMVTASHNPAQDNGYKVYLGGQDDGSQIVPPADAEIAAHIARIAETTPVSRIPRLLSYQRAPERLVDAYVAATAAVGPAPAGAESIRWVYTAMHGVGWDTMRAIAERAGYAAPTVVDEQIAPDPDFPTVAFPNPEEAGAMDLAFAKAREIDADLVVANDPDADRLAVGIPDATAAEGWRRLTGNEVGLLLGWRAARRVVAAGHGGLEDETSLACSLVSSPGLEAIAEHYGLDFHTTLTGFKWISRAPGLAFGFEEALGYLVNPQTVRDKDGISAAVAMLELAADARARGTDIAGLLTEFDEQFGAYASDQISLRVDDLAVIGRIMSALRADPPERIGVAKVRGVDDFRDGVDGLPPSDILRFRLKGSGRVIVRPSGTEPKLKVYIDVRGTSREDAAQRRAALTEGARALLASMS